MAALGTCAVAALLLPAVGLIPGPEGGGTLMMRLPSGSGRRPDGLWPRSGGRPLGPISAWSTRVAQEAGDTDAGDADAGDGEEIRVRNRRRWGRRGAGALMFASGAAVVLKRVSPRPVVLVHGVLQTADFMREVADWIHAEMPGTYVRAVEIGNGYLDSISRSMNWQTDDLAAKVARDPKLQRGFNLIGYSQGSLICRAYIERYNRPPVFNFLSWMGPQGGQFGVPDYEPLLKHLNWITSPMWYTDQLQDRVSFANYWRDPFRLPLYRERSSFLADINNEREPRNATYKANLASLESMLLVYSTVDTIIVPRESGWFAAFRENSSSELVPLEDSALYREDWIGLRTLAETNRLHFGVTNCKHYEVVTSACKFQLFDKLSLPYLLPPSTVGLSLVKRLLPRRRRGNARDGGGGRGGWQGPPSDYDETAVEREELALLRRRCVELSSQLGQMRVGEGVMQARVEALRRDLKRAQADLDAARGSRKARKRDAGTGDARSKAADELRRLREENEALRRERSRLRNAVGALKLDDPTDADAIKRAIDEREAALADARIAEDEALLRNRSRARAAYVRRRQTSWFQRLLPGGVRRRSSRVIDGEAPAGGRPRPRWRQWLRNPLAPRR